MASLLDTHTLLWALTDPASLSVRARRVISDPGSALVVSAASAWEVATKARLGKLPAADVLIAGWGRHLHRLGCTSLAVTDEHALLAGSLVWEHRDPFDRMLAAQSMCEGLPLITKDSAFTALAGVATVW